MIVTLITFAVKKRPYLASIAPPPFKGVLKARNVITPLKIRE